MDVDDTKQILDALDCCKTCKEALVKLDLAGAAVKRSFEEMDCILFWREAWQWHRRAFLKLSTGLISLIDAALLDASKIVRDEFQSRCLGCEKFK